MPCNGGIRVSLLAFALTRPTREGEYRARWYRLAPHADSLKLLKTVHFPSLSLNNSYAIVYIKPRNVKFVKLIL